MKLYAENDNLSESPIRNDKEWSCKFPFIKDNLNCLFLNDGPSKPHEEHGFPFDGLFIGTAIEADDA